MISPVFFYRHSINASAYWAQVAPSRLPVITAGQIAMAFSSFSAASMRQICRSSIAAALMIERGMGEYANPASIIKAASMMLRHICRIDAAAKIENALDTCTVEVKSDGTAATAAEYTDALMALL